MQILESVYDYLRFIGLSANESIRKYPFNARNLTSILIYVANIICNVGFLISGAKDLMEFTDSVYITYTIICATSVTTDLVLKMRQLFKFLGNLEDTVNQRLENPISTTIYAKANEKIQKAMRILKFVFPKLSPIMVTIPPCLASLAAYFTTDLDPEALELPFPMWFPFDTDNLTGFLIACSITYVFTFNLAVAIMGIMVVAITPNLILTSITEDMKSNLNTLNRSARRNQNADEFLHQFNRFVQFHSNAKQLVRAYAKIMEFMFAVIFAWSMGSIGMTFFIVQIELQRGASNSVLAQRGQEIVFAMGNVLVCCEFGHKLSKAFEDINDTIDRLNWYKFPVKIWKYLPTLIVGAQTPAELCVFGSVSCTREDFKNVFNTGCSYFMVLRKFDFDI